MLHPTIDELTTQDFNRYEIALATAKCARILTDEYVRQKEAAEKAIGNAKDADRSVINKLNKEYREEKALKNALTMIKSGEYVLVRLDGTETEASAEGEPAAEEETATAAETEQTEEKATEEETAEEEVSEEETAEAETVQAATDAE